MEEYQDYKNTVSEEEIINTIVEAEDNHDPSACMKLAEWYKTGTVLEQSDEEYVKMLHKAYEYADESGNIQRLMKDWYDEEFGNEHFTGVAANISVDEWKAGAILGSAAYKLGLYYANFNIIEELRKAENYFRVSLWCHFDTRSLLKDTAQRIQNLEYAAEDPSLSPVLTSFRQTIFRNISLRTIDEYAVKTLTSVNANLKEEFSEESWNKLQRETQIYLSTALMTFGFYTGVGQDNYKDVDFSSCISLLMRGLEYEIKLRFYKGYLSYLQDKYSDPARYIEKNKLDRSDVTKTRTTILYKDRSGDLHYKDYRISKHSYTLGSITASIGYENTNNEDNVKVDATFMEYCKNALIESEWDRNAIKEWIHNICDNVEALRVMRNNASHGGRVLTEADAEYVLDQMVFTQKILEKLASACRY